MATIGIVALLFMCISGEALQTHPGQFLAVHEDDAANLCEDGRRSWPACNSAPWKPSPNRNATKEICIEGKSLPKLYVLGAQKTSTSSFANDLACAGVSAVPSRAGNEKEFSYFVARFKWGGAEGERDGWLKALPDCNAQNPKLVADLTPNNLRMVNGETPYGSSIPINLPNTLKTFYGKEQGKVTLVAMIRDPLSRMQSAWYAARRCSNHAICTQDCRGESFQEDLKTALSNARQSPPLYTEWLWTSMYGRHLEEWLQHFDAQQMYVIPYKQYSKGDADAICRNLAKRLEFDMDCESNGREPSHSWKNEHPSLKDDLRPEIIDDFNAIMDQETDRLAQALADGHAKGLGLANFDGAKGSKAEIRAWLEAWW